MKAILNLKTTRLLKCILFKIFVNGGGDGVLRAGLFFMMIIVIICAKKPLTIPKIREIVFGLATPPPPQPQLWNLLLSPCIFASTHWWLKLCDAYRFPYFKINKN
jgi:hypothetical protein